MIMDRLIGWKELSTLVPYSRMHVWRLEKQGMFPRRRQLGPHRVAWLLSEIKAWMDNLLPPAA